MSYPAISPKRLRKSPFNGLAQQLTLPFRRQ